MEAPGTTENKGPFDQRVANIVRQATRSPATGANEKEKEQEEKQETKTATRGMEGYRPGQHVQVANGNVGSTCSTDDSIRRMRPGPRNGVSCGRRW